MRRGREMRCEKLKVCVLAFLHWIFSATCDRGGVVSAVYFSHPSFRRVVAFGFGFGIWVWGLGLGVLGIRNVSLLMVVGYMDSMGIYRMWWMMKGGGGWL